MGKYIDPRATPEEINAHFRKWAEQGPTIVTSRTICPRCKTSFDGLFSYMPAHECVKPLPHTQDSDCVLDEQSQCVMCGVDHSADPCASCLGRAFHVAGCPNSDETVDNDDILLSALNTFIDSAAKLSEVWERIGGLEDGYPECLPSFDEFLHHLYEWRGANLDKDGKLK